jgi:acylphosphatase
MTVGETISGDGEVLPCLVICAAQLHLEGWVHNNLDGDTLMAISETGYTNDELALEWLKHFEKFSKKR